MWKKGRFVIGPGPPLSLLRSPPLSVSVHHFVLWADAQKEWASIREQDVCSKNICPVSVAKASKLRIQTLCSVHVPPFLISYLSSPFSRPCPVWFLGSLICEFWDSPLSLPRFLPRSIFSSQLYSVIRQKRVIWTSFDVFFTFRSQKIQTQ